MLGCRVSRVAWRSDCRRACGEFHGFHFGRCIGKVLAGACLSDRFWVGHWIQRLRLPSGEEHPGASGNLRVRESVVAFSWVGSFLPSLSLRTFLAAGVILTAVILVITAPHPEPVRGKEPLPAAGEA